MDHPVGVAEQFTPQGRVLALREYGRGNVNDTFLVTVEGAAEPHFILQRLNLRVFRRPELVMRNLGIVGDHVARRLARAPLSHGRRFEVPRVLLTRDGRDHFIDPGGSFWRALSFIDAAETFDIIKDAGHAGEVGYALGRFHSLLSNLAPEHLADTLPGFHLTPGYLAHYDEVLGKHELNPSHRESLEKGLWERDCKWADGPCPLSQTLSPNPHKGGLRGEFEGRAGEAYEKFPPALPLIFHFGN